MRIPSVEDRLFARFRRTGDARALGALFDRTAPDLLKVARYLVGERALAEDLVQATFVDAIDHRDRHDASRPVLPWLIGILNNLARDMRRARARAEKVTVAAEPDRDPAAAAADAEFRAAFAAALRGLPSPYRDVVALHLDDGLRAVDIAERLARSADTVRKQLARGLALLRRALPPGFAAALVVAGTSGGGLAAMRAQVMQQAEGAGAGSLAGGGSLAAVGVGAFLMHKVILGVGVAVLAVGACLIWANAGDVRVASPSVAEAGPVFGATARAKDAPLETEPAPARDRVPVTPARDPRELTVRGQCVDGATRTPLPACTVALRAWPQAGASDEGATWQEPPAVTTDGQGRFTIGARVPRSHAAGIGVELDGYVSLSVHWSAGVSGDRDLGPIALRAGCRLAGTLKDARGVAQPGVEIGIDVSAEPPAQSIADATWHEHAAGDTVTNADGTWSCPWPLPAGALRFTVAQRRLREPTAPVVEPGERARHFDLVTQPWDESQSISGVVVDAAGTPVRRGSVVASNTLRREVRCELARDGSFRIERHVDLGPGKVWLVAWPEGCERLRRDEPVACGDHGIRLVVRREASMAVEVVDAVTAAPIEEFSLWCYSADAPMGSGIRARTTGRHANGRAVVSAPRGVHVMRVAAKGFASSELRRVAVDEPVPTQHFALGEASSGEFVVRRRDGTPVGNSMVEILEPARGKAASVSTFVIGRGASSVDDQAFVLGEGRTDAEGRVQLTVPRGRPFAARALGPGHVPAVVAIASVVGAEPIVIQVDTGARLRGRVVPVSAIALLMPPESASDKRGEPSPFRPTLKLHRYAGDQHPTLAIAADGTFATDGIAPGDWELFLQSWVVKDGVGTGETELVSELWGLRADEEREITVDLSHVAFADLRCRVLVNGSTVAKAHLSFRDQRGAVRTHPIEADMVVARVRAGTYQPEVYLVVGDFAVMAPAPAITVRPGILNEFEIRAYTAELRVRLIGERGESCGELPVYVGRRGMGFGDRFWTDVGGRVPRRELAAGSYFARVLPPRWLDPNARAAHLGPDAERHESTLWIELGDFEVARGAPELVLRVPSEALR